MIRKRFPLSRSPVKVYQVCQMGTKETYNSKRVSTFATSIPTSIIWDGPGYAMATASIPQWFTKTVFCPYHMFIVSWL